MRRPAFSEQWLRDLWEHRPAQSLRTDAGKSITVLSPGTPNYDSGPDFTGALVRIGGVLFRGDVEMHVHAGEWAAHRHHLDARYNSVILHVAFRASPLPALTASGRELPLLLFPPPVSAPGPGMSVPSRLRTEPPAMFCPLPFPADRPALLRRLSSLGMQRMGMKVARMEERLADLLAENTPVTAGAQYAQWEQILYEGILEGLGYSKNREPFLRLARILELADLRRIGLQDREGILAALFGTAGLLPPSGRVFEEESRRVVRRLRLRWMELDLGIQAMHETEWRSFRLRPANLPTARLASLAFLLPRLFGPAATEEILSLFSRQESSAGSRLFQLREKFLIRPDGFWERHLSFYTQRESRGIALGRRRADDIIVNTFFPWLLLYARQFRRGDIERNVLLTYRTFPPLQQNRITGRVERLLTRFPLASAQLHQGALEWVRRFCGQQRCALCPLRRS